MKFINYYLALSLIAVVPFHAQASVEREIVKRQLTDKSQLVFLKESRFPTYLLTIYFADGALSDEDHRRGETEAMFSNLVSGTTRYGQAHIAEAFEFYGTTFETNVTHEYATVSLSGLSKDLVPNVRMMCHLFKEANFPENEIRLYQRRLISDLDSLVTNHSELANRVFRELSLSRTPYAFPVEGKIVDIKKLTSKGLAQKRDYFKKEVSKRFYFTGQEESLEDLKRVVKDECDFNLEGAGFARVENNKPVAPEQRKKIYLIPVPGANQAQVRVGRFLNSDELADPDMLTMTAGFLGGGFTSPLMREVRHNRGLSYGVYANASAQRQYGRAVISSFTKNPTLIELLGVIHGVLGNYGENLMDKQMLEDSVAYLAGSHLFQFENGPAYISALVAIDHQGRKYEDLYLFPERIKKFQRFEVKEAIASIFDWEKMTIVVVGGQNLERELEKMGAVQVLDYRKFL